MNPYLPPSTVASDKKDQASAGTTLGVTVGRRCEQCGSTNTSDEQALRSKPSIIAVIFFGWVFLLIRSAFSKQRELCNDCGAIRLYKSTGSKLAMVFLLVLVLLIAIGYLAPSTGS